MQVGASGCENSKAEVWVQSSIPNRYSFVKKEIFILSSRQTLHFVGKIP